jgi:7-cyano-7-deazaguanine synthase in queuosine biosynthesis
MQAILLMLSGGLDSTYLLHHYLTRTDLAVHAHHIAIRYPYQPRWRREGAAVQGIVEYCRTHCRAFEYSESAFALDLPGDLGWDSDLQLLVASKVVPSIQAEWITVALGWSTEDLQHPMVAERSRRQVTPNLWRALWASINRNEHIDPELATPLLAQQVSKADMLRALPRALARRCWSCRERSHREELEQPCGSCHACLFNLQALRAAGMNAQEWPNLVPPPPDPARQRTQSGALPGPPGSSDEGP